MIASVEGQIIRIRPESLLINVHGIGFELFVANPGSYQLNSNVFFWTFMQVREEGMTLFGFPDEKAYELFVRLIKIRGIGCKTALNMLGAMDAAHMLEAIEHGDLKALKSLPGIGSKTASQIILDLQGKIVLPASEGPVQNTFFEPAWAETKEALLALGYKPVQLAGLEKEFGHRNDLSVDELLRLCLQRFAK